MTPTFKRGSTLRAQLQFIDGAIVAAAARRNRGAAKAPVFNSKVRPKADRAARARY